MNSQAGREIRAVAYLRVARAAEANADDQIDAQRAGCEEIAKRFGAHLVREYIDIGKSARLEQQVELQRLCSDLATSRDAGYVVVWDYTRLARDLRDLEEIIQRVRDCGAEVATLTGVEVAERFMQGLSTDQARPEMRHLEQPVLYPMALLQAAHRGLSVNQTLSVRAVLPSGETIRGRVIGIGSRLSISAAGARLIEDVQAEWVVKAEIRQAATKISEEDK